MGNLYNFDATLFRPLGAPCENDVIPAAPVRQRLRGFQQFSLPRREGGRRPQLRPRLLHEGEQLLPEGHEHQVVPRILVSGEREDIRNQLVWGDK